MALGNLADLEELEPTPGRPDPLTLYHQVTMVGGGVLGGSGVWPGEPRCVLSPPCCPPGHPLRPYLLQQRAHLPLPVPGRVPLPQQERQGGPGGLG